jgi:LysR family glycine cleavage system transcriptional activator
MVSGHRLPSLASIRAFEAAARLGSFAKAAQELDTTSAAVSYHVRRLEQQIGVPLFVRHPNHVCLTQSGEIVAREAMNAFAALRASFIRAVDADEARLSLTTLPTLGTSWLTPKLGKFRSRCPDILLGLDLSAIPEDLTAGRFDAAIRNGHGGWPGLHTAQLLPSIFMPLCAPTLKDAAANIANPRSPLAVRGSADLNGGRCGIAHSALKNVCRRRALVRSCRPSISMSPRPLQDTASRSVRRSSSGMSSPPEN